MNALPNASPYKVAVSFFDAAKILERQDCEFIEVIVMQYAFAAELSLKCFFIKKNLPAKQKSSNHNFPLKDQTLAVKKNGYGHDINDLFSRIDPSVKNKLRTLFREETGKDIDELIEKCANYFVQSRYWFEKYGVLDVTSVEMLARGLIKATSRYLKEVGED